MWAKAAAVSLVLLTSGVALADGAGAGAVQRAAEHFDEGSRAYQAARYEEAASHFEAAFAAVPNARVLRLAVRARDAAGQPERAATLASLAQARYGSDAETMTLASDVLKKVGARLANVNVRCTAPCLLAVGELAVVGGIDAQHTVYVVPGKVTLHASFATGGEASRTIDARAGETSEVELAPSEETEEPAPEPVSTKSPKKAPPKPAAVAPAPAPPQTTVLEPDPHPHFAPKPEQPSADAANLAPKKDAIWYDPGTRDDDAMSPWYKSRGLFFTSLGATAVLGGVTTWSGLDTLKHPGKDAVRAACVGLGTACPEYQLGLQKQLRTNALIGATTATGVLTIVIGAALTEFSPGAAAHASAWVTPSEGGVVARGSF